MYCNIRCEGFNEQYGDGRTVYDYYKDNSKYIEYTRGEKLPETTWDLYEKQEYETGNTFTSKNELFKYIKKECDNMLLDNYYYNIYIGCDDIDLIKYLNLNDELNPKEDEIYCYAWRYDEIHKYYIYPKKPLIADIKKLAKHKTSIKEDIFINICKKYIPDLENQVLFTIDNKKYIVDGYSKHNNLVIEFLGDYYHGNPNVYNANYLNDKLKKTFGELYDEWVMRKNIFNSLNYKVIYLWEDDYNRMGKKDIHNWVLSQIN